MKKIKWKNVIKLLIMLACICIVIHDIYMVSFSQFFTGNLVGWTWFGFISFIIAFIVASILFDSLFGKEVF